ncbi:MAG: 50S ribosomal protein L19 [Dehalococcoidia bacterium]|nr:50S ribosomal protein L19 [Dehalococcoidia bacterium]
MSKDISWMLETKGKSKLPQISPGDRVKVSVKTKEGDKERTQVFSGIVIRVRKGAARASFTVRHVAYGIGVERTFFMNSPYIEKVEIVTHGDVRRARLFYLRGLSSRASRAKLKSKARIMAPELVVEEQPEAEEEAEAAEAAEATAETTDKKE